MLRYSLETYVFDTRREMGLDAAKAVSEKICALLKTKDEIRMIFAAAPSQNEFLEALVNGKAIDFTRITAFHMDEYVALAADAPQGFGNFLRDRLFGLAPFKKVHYINGNAADIDAECRRYAALLGEAPIDIVCMGIGENGHIAFNDPHVALIDDPEDVKCVLLDDVCRMQQVHDGCFKTLDDVPKAALTLTVPRLMRAGSHFCMVPAPTKANAVRASLHGELGNHCPATVLRILPDAKLYLDKDSAALL